MHRFMLSSRAFTAFVLVGLLSVLLFGYQNCGKARFQRMAANDGKPCVGDNCSHGEIEEAALIPVVQNGGQYSLGDQESSCKNLTEQEIQNGLHRKITINLMAVNFIPTDYFCLRVAPIVDMQHNPCNVSPQGQAAKSYRPDGGENENPPRLGDFFVTSTDGTSVQMYFQEVANGDYILEYFASGLTQQQQEFETHPVRVRFKVEDCGAPQPTPSPSPSISPNPTGSPTPSASPSPASSPTPASSPSPSASPSPTSSPTPASSPSPSASPSPTSSPTPTATPSPTPQTNDFSINGVMSPPEDTNPDGVLVNKRNSPVFVITDGGFPFYRVNIDAGIIIKMTSMWNSLTNTVDPWLGCVNQIVTATDNLDVSRKNLTLPNCEFKPDIDKYNVQVWGLKAPDEDGVPATNNNFNFVLEPPVPPTPSPTPTVSFKVMGVHKPIVDTSIDEYLKGTNINPVFRVSNLSGALQTVALPTYFHVVVKNPRGGVRDIILCDEKIQIPVNVVAPDYFDLATETCFLPNADLYRLEVSFISGKSEYFGEPNPYLFNVSGPNESPVKPTLTEQKIPESEPVTKLTLQRDAALANFEVHIKYNVKPGSPAATNGEDFSLDHPSEYVFKPGTGLAQSIAINVKDDALIEQNEFFVVEFYEAFYINASGVEVNIPLPYPFPTHKVEILDNDTDLKFAISGILSPPDDSIADAFLINSTKPVVQVENKGVYTFLVEYESSMTTSSTKLCSKEITVPAIEITHLNLDIGCQVTTGQSFLVHVYAITKLQKVKAANSPFKFEAIQRPLSGFKILGVHKPPYDNIVDNVFTNAYLNPIIRVTNPGPTTNKNIKFQVLITRQSSYSGPITTVCNESYDFNFSAQDVLNIDIPTSKCDLFSGSTSYSGSFNVSVTMYDGTNRQANASNNPFAFKVVSTIDPPEPTACDPTQTCCPSCDDCSTCVKAINYSTGTYKFSCVPMSDCSPQPLPSPSSDPTSFR